MGAAAALAALATRPAGAHGAEPPNACVRFVGDVSLARGVDVEIGLRHASPWLGFPRDAVLVGNFESALDEATSPSCGKPASLCLGAKPARLRLLAEAGFGAVSLENNHTRDFGGSARVRLEDDLRRLAVRPVVAGSQPVFLEVGSGEDRTRWGLVALDLTIPDAAERHRALERARLEIGRAAAEADFVAVLVHAGLEGSRTASPAQGETSEVLLRWGASAVIGSHPHVVQEFVCGQSGLAAYSLGNHLFDSPDPSTWTAAAVNCCTRSRSTNCSIDATERRSESTFPRWTGRALAPACALKKRDVDRQWQVHRGRDRFVFVQRMRSAGENAYFALHRGFSDFDSEVALRPYVFRVDGSRTVDLWRGTSLAYPLVAARLIEVGGREFLCAIHRGDTFFERRPATLARRRVVYRWTGFGFASVEDEEAQRECARM